MYISLLHCYIYHCNSSYKTIAKIPASWWLFDCRLLAQLIYKWLARGISRSRSLLDYFYNWDWLIRIPSPKHPTRILMTPSGLNNLSLHKTNGYKFTITFYSTNAVNTSELSRNCSLLLRKLYLIRAWLWKSQVNLFVVGSPNGHGNSNIIYEKCK